MPSRPATPRAASAIRANVSALLSSTCERRRATPLRIDGGRPRSAGRAGPPVIARITAVASPATNVAGPIDSSIGRASRRSARAIARRAREVRAVGADPHDDPGSPEGSGSGDGAVEDQVRDVAEQHAVLAAGRLPLGAVDDHVRDARAGQRRQLAIGRERRTAGTDHLVRRPPGRSGRRWPGEGRPPSDAGAPRRFDGPAGLDPGQEQGARARAAPWGAGRGAGPGGRARAGPGPVGDQPSARDQAPAGRQSGPRSSARPPPRPARAAPPARSADGRGPGSPGRTGRPRR